MSQHQHKNGIGLTQKLSLTWLPRRDGAGLAGPGSCVAEAAGIKDHREGPGGGDVGRVELGGCVAGVRERKEGDTPRVRLLDHLDGAAVIGGQVGLCDGSGGSWRE